MKIKPVGPPKISISYEGIIVEDDGCLVVIAEIVGIVLFLMLIHAI